MKYMDKFPTVISCCFCCFLRAGTVMISVVSFFAGLILAPNVRHNHGFWDMNGAISKGSTFEMYLQMILGCVSIMLCVVSVLLLVGALCNVPKMIELYQYGAIIYSSTVFFLFLILAIYCIFVHGNCFLAAGLLVLLMICNILLTAYFIIVANSLRLSMMYLAADSFQI